MTINEVAKRFGRPIPDRDCKDRMVITKSEPTEVVTIRSGGITLTLGPNGKRHVAVEKPAHKKKTEK